MRQIRIAVVGAGPAGLVAALTARAFGLSVEVFERAPASGDAGRGLLLHSNGQRVLDALGLLEPFRPHMRPTRLLTIELPGGRRLSTFDYRKLSVPHNSAAVVLRHELRDHLLEAARREGVPVHFDHRLIALSLGRGVASLRFANGSEHPFDLVIASDGSHSQCRASLGLPTRKRAIGEACLQTVAERAAARSHGREIWGTDGRRFGILPLPGERSYIYCTAPFGTWRETLATGGLDAWIASWKGYGPEVTALLETVTDWDRVPYDELQELRVRRWYRDPVFLVGDAAHAMTPNLGQGANAAMVDALVVIRLLARALNEPGALGGRGTLEAVGRAYEGVRRAFVLRTQLRSRRVGALASRRSAPARALRNATLRLTQSMDSLNRETLRLGAGYNPAEESYFEALTHSTTAA